LDRSKGRFLCTRGDKFGSKRNECFARECLGRDCASKPILGAIGVPLS
jgi:hypothetical protein